GVNLAFEDNPTYELKPLINDVGIIAAQSEVIVPVIARYKDTGAAAAKTSRGPLVQAQAFGSGCIPILGQASGYYRCGLQQVINSTILQAFWNCLPSPNQTPRSTTPASPPQPPTASPVPAPVPTATPIQLNTESGSCQP